MAAFPSTGGDEQSLAYLKESQAAEKVYLEKSLSASEEKLANGERRIQEFENSKDTMDDISSEADEAEAMSKSSEE